MGTPFPVFNLAPNERFVQCPYNVAHQVTNHRLVVHLDKCARNYRREVEAMGGRVEMVSCKWNFAHKMQQPEQTFHEGRCPDQYNIVNHVQFHSSKEFEEKFRVAPGVKQRIPDRPKLPYEPDEEDWEEECRGNEAGYDPSERLASEVTLYNPRGLSRSERKAFRADARVRAADAAIKIERPDRDRVYPYPVKKVRQEDVKQEVKVKKEKKEESKDIWGQDPYA